MKNIAILGASGYTGAELIRLISTHGGMRIAALGGNSKAGQSIAQVFPFLRHLDLPDLVTIEQINWDGIDLCFCALPHKTSQEVIANLPRDLKIVDLSADFRLRDPEAYAAWYGNAHSAVEMQGEAVYGLTEFYRDEISKARLVAGTGCNAATGQFALRPLITAGVIDLDHMILDLKCAVSGAGRSLKENLLHAELSEGYNAYALGSTHRHLGEFDQEFSQIAGREVKVQFTPHLVPANRGILATAHVHGEAAQLHDVLQAAAGDEPLLQVLPFRQAPSTHDGRGYNFFHLGVPWERITCRASTVDAFAILSKGLSCRAFHTRHLLPSVACIQCALVSPPRH